MAPPNDRLSGKQQMWRMALAIIVIWGAILFFPLYAQASTWSTYGGGPGHSRDYAPHWFDRGLQHHAYAISTPGLMEFPPSVTGGVGYVATDSGNVKAFRVSDGSTIWSTSIGGIAADSPTIANGRVFVQTRGGTGLNALSVATGAVLWRLTGFGGESTPTVVGKNICGAASDGRVGCWNQATGRGVWHRSVPCKVTASLTYSGGFLWFGCYRGWLFKVNPKHGKLIWKRRGPGAVYANVVARHGLVYVTYRDAGSIWAWSTTGVRRWVTHLGGGAAYTSPAVTSTSLYTTTRSGAGGRGTFIKIDALTGRVRWRSTAPGLVMGSPVVTGNRVWFAAMGKHFTPGCIYGFNVNGMHRTYTFNSDGRYSPVVPAGHTLLMVGQTHIYGVR